MFYGQCWKCGERWGLGTASACKCPDEYPKQEPVIDKSAAIRIATALGWTPQRTWVGLTDEEIMEPWPFENRVAFARWLEAKLKEKNT